MKKKLKYDTVTNLAKLSKVESAIVSVEKKTGMPGKFKVPKLKVPKMKLLNNKGRFK
jgi:hypothetical protein